MNLRNTTPIIMKIMSMISMNPSKTETVTVNGIIRKMEMKGMVYGTIMKVLFLMIIVIRSFIH